MPYLWKKPEWPAFSWRSSELLDVLVKARHEQGRLLSLPSSFVHSFEVSEVKNAIYTDFANLELTLSRLHGWQASLFPTGYAGVKKIKTAALRSFNFSNRATVECQNLNSEVTQFLTWWGEPPVELDPVIRAALSFLWFYLLSPYEAGNFELASSIAELALQQSENLKLRTYDISVQLEENQSEVLKKIEAVASGSGDVTDWLVYFLKLYRVAVDSAFIIADKNQTINLFWKNFSNLDLNARQRKVLNHMLEEGIEITNRHYVELCKTSRESVKRDLGALVRLNILKLGSKKGRSVSYSLICQH